MASLKWIRSKRPKDVFGYSRSGFKRILKINGHKFKRNFWINCFSTYNDRLYRWRFNDGELDISCHLNEFDRWANSTAETVKIKQWLGIP